MKTLRALLCMFVVLAFTLTTTAFAYEAADPNVLIDNDQVRVAMVDGIRAEYNKTENLLTLTIDGQSYTMPAATVSMAMQAIDRSQLPVPFGGNTTLESESLMDFRYQVNLSSGGNKYYSIAKPETDYISVWDDSSVACEYAEEFKDHVDDALGYYTDTLVAEWVTVGAVIITIVTGGFAAVAASVVLAAASAMGIVLSGGIAQAAASMITSLAEAEECYDIVASLV